MRKPTKYKVQFNKFKDGQAFFERSLSLDNIELLLILCNDCKIEFSKRKKTGQLTFIFNGTEYNTFVTAKKLPEWILKKFLPQKEWTNK